MMDSVNGNSQPKVNVSACDAVTLTLLTSASPGAVAIIQLHGPGVTGMLARLTGKNRWPVQRAMLVDFADIDHGLALRWRDDWAQLMPHGGPRVVQKIVDKLITLGAQTHDANACNHQLIYPEAACALEADMLACLASAASPGAVDRLLSQMAIWTTACETLATWKDEQVQALLERSDRLDRLVMPPTAAVMGQPNVGKSTLTNVMLGRSASIVADMPGTTRDWVAGMTQLAGVSFRWLDTPGVRESDDVIEQHAIGLSRQVIEQADVVIAMRDPQTAWPQWQAGDREPDLWVMNKSDSLDADQVRDVSKTSVINDGSSRERPLWISAKDSLGIEQMGDAILKCMGQGKWLAADVTTQLWAFNVKLREMVRKRDVAGLKTYLGR